MDTTWVWKAREAEDAPVQARGLPLKLVAVVGLHAHCGPPPPPSGARGLGLGERRLGEGSGYLRLGVWEDAGPQKGRKVVARGRGDSWLRVFCGSKWWQELRVWEWCLLLPVRPPASFPPGLGRVGAPASRSRDPSLWDLPAWQPSANRRTRTGREAWRCHIRKGAGAGEGGRGRRKLPGILAW